MNNSNIKLCVFCASSPHVHENYIKLAKDAGKRCADADWGLVYGGGQNGLMGAAADAALLNGGDVIGVIPKHLKDKEVAHEGLTKLHITNTMHERQMKMTELSDAFFILPGGTGTLAEFFEILTWKQLKLHEKPIVLINHNGYWDDLISMLQRAQKEQFLYGGYDDHFRISYDLDDAFEYLQSLFVEE